MDGKDRVRLDISSGREGGAYESCQPGATFDSPRKCDLISEIGMSRDQTHDLVFV